MSTSHLAFLGPIGGPEMIMIFVVILLLFGAKKLPELARGVGKSMGEFKKAREEFEREITRSEEDTMRDKDKESRKVREDYERKMRDEKAEEARIKPVSEKETHDI